MSLNGFAKPLFVFGYLASLAGIVTDTKKDFASPVLLQQLLQSMEDPTASRGRPIDYAVLSLAVRLIAAQSSVFSLWYSRRCYERSRGELLTMLHAKTLARKNLRTSMQSKTTEAPRACELDALKMTKGNPALGWAKLFTKLRKLCGCLEPTASKVAEPASTGKVYNLMRYEHILEFVAITIDDSTAMTFTKSHRGK